LLRPRFHGAGDGAKDPVEAVRAFARPERFDHRGGRDGDEHEFCEGHITQRDDAERRTSLALDAGQNGSSIPVSKVSWTTLGAGGGTGWNPTLSSSSFALVFQSNPATPSGHVDLVWTLTAPGSGIRAGIHQLTIRWKVESITP
jgi:hypothetical protein